MLTTVIVGVVIVAACAMSVLANLILALVVRRQWRHIVHQAECLEVVVDAVDDLEKANTTLAVAICPVCHCVQGGCDGECES